MTDKIRQWRRHQRDPQLSGYAWKRGIRQGQQSWLRLTLCCAATQRREKEGQTHPALALALMCA
eukprot:CAMPEP_0194766940 /NCGR_PEP_ID=MMETSP0323_2-20130528/33791_1 /TAXON_ID=2866 ORGANISM="Crypthecodinium cohnii, Strain Seligo" /NCGR_SAMPLE_ID=MMETSP0323_2 /ASSEMBLY_ACC=CAM_ASM_000346 /LENGTH=63 /DNA_ID=CAMNT_0039698267 /DNA_START=340 /DNA_END=531 /DNA_ORIENTATION=-